MLEALAEEHLELLLQFELDNREWFEAFVSPRGAQFYTKQGIKKHVDELIAEVLLNKSFAGVFIENGKITARANLKDINVDKRSCFIGYRVAKKSAGKGLATRCVAELILKAQTLYGITELQAQVLSNNPASIAVLKKNGFKALYYEENYLDLNGESYGCTTFKRESN